MSDHKMRKRWEARRKAISDDFFAGDEAHAETVLDALPYSAIPDWSDVALLMQSMSAAGLLTTPERDAEVAARALREAVAWMDESTPDDGEMVTRLQAFEFFNDYADRIERGEEGAS